MGTKDHEQRRQNQRWKVFEVAAVHAEGGSSVCVIDDISADGALVTCDLDLIVGQEVVFEIEEFGMIPAVVRHTRESFAGLSLILDEDLKKAFIAWLEATEKEPHRE